LQRREEREFERKLLSLAKERHHEVYGAGAPINRVKIRKFKRELRKQLRPGSFTQSEGSERKSNESFVS